MENCVVYWSRHLPIKTEIGGSNPAGTMSFFFTGLILSDILRISPKSRKKSMVSVGFDPAISDFIGRYLDHYTRQLLIQSV